MRNIERLHHDRVKFMGIFPTSIGLPVELPLNHVPAIQLQNGAILNLRMNRLFERLSDHDRRCIRSITKAEFTNQAEQDFLDRLTLEVRFKKTTNNKQLINNSLRLQQALTMVVQDVKTNVSTFFHDGDPKDLAQVIMNNIQHHIYF